MIRTERGLRWLLLFGGRLGPCFGHLDGAGELLNGRAVHVHECAVVVAVKAAMLVCFSSEPSTWPETL